ncbi:MAG: 16S rRNA (guanine(966)-N(2))-methyltransferase RsmD [Clostridiales bacterium]|nr:16S rRNA (guanine(966)-N(2))-methyltransferase RsmD [Clostridiales bacterium]
MRVIAGKYKGRNIISPSRGEVRPTTDMVKGSLFSILESRTALEGARCLDIFCGSGALGIEALSRGAESCVFLDKDTVNAQKNLDKIGISPRMVRADYVKGLRLLRGEKFDIIFCDPPYKTDFGEDALRLVFKYALLADGGIIIIEHNREKRLINAPNDCIIDRREFGITALEIITRGNSESDNSGIV